MAHEEQFEIRLPAGKKGSSFKNQIPVEVKCEIYEPQVRAEFDAFDLQDVSYLDVPEISFLFLCTGCCCGGAGPRQSTRGAQRASAPQPHTPSPP